MPVLRGRLEREGAIITVQLGWSAAQAHQLRQAHRPVPSALDTRALLDTGAEITCVDGFLVQQLGLPLAQLGLANVPAACGLPIGAHYHAGVTIAHPSANLFLCRTS